MNAYIHVKEFAPDEEHNKVYVTFAWACDGKGKTNESLELPLDKFDAATLEAALKAKVEGKSGKSITEMTSVK